MMEETRIHHYSPKYHWAHPGECQPWCTDWYKDSQTGPCEGRVCEVVRAWKKEAPK